MDNKELVLAKLAEIAAIAKSAELDLRNGRFWEGELSDRLGRIQAAIQDVIRLKGHDR